MVLKFLEAISIALLSISVAIPFQFGFASAKAMLIAPEPVPRSTKVIFSSLFLNMPETISIKSSVSGRGIRTLFETSNFKFLQKEIPLKYCMGIEAVSYTHLTLPTTPYV